MISELSDKFNRGSLLVTNINNDFRGLYFVH